jgi:Rps23 Pro-64 3,4-dihydroxylase Tpa1-like proline 4-hydroxylase
MNPRTHIRKKNFFTDKNEATRFDQFDELNDLTTAALRAFFRRMGTPHLFEEVVLPMFNEGDSQIFVAVRDRPWPPWGLGARYITAVCQVHLVADDTFGISPVYVADDNLTNVGLISALYKEVLGYLALNNRAEVNYLVAEGSTLAHITLTTVGFEKTEDVFLTENTRYFTYRASPAKLLRGLLLEHISTPELLAHQMSESVLRVNAGFQGSIYLGSRAEWTTLAPGAAELAALVRGGHYGKPGGVPSGTGRFGYEQLEDPEWTRIFISYENFLSADEHKELLDFVLSQQQSFDNSTVQFQTREMTEKPATPVVNENIRRSKTLNDLGRFEAVFNEKIKQNIVEVLKKLTHDQFEIERIEIQATASNDGDYFRMHQDSGEDSTREISFVYFFYQEPKRYSGGELRIFETKIINGRPVPVDRSQTLIPRQNQIVFFPSRHEHEVLPVRVPSKAFPHSRFTINGWIHIKDRTPGSPQETEG